VRKINQRASHRHTRESGYPEVFDFPGFRVALAIASLPRMTLKLFNGFREHHTNFSLSADSLRGILRGLGIPLFAASCGEIKPAVIELRGQHDQGHEYRVRHSRMLLSVVRPGSPQARPELDPRLKHSGVTPWDKFSSLCSDTPSACCGVVHCSDKDPSPSFGMTHASFRTMLLNVVQNQLALLVFLCYQGENFSWC
jgi:hypothetical protein